MTTELKKAPRKSRSVKTAQPELPLAGHPLPGTAELGGKLYYLTNRMNVLSSLSSGLIRPKESLDKYYQDLMALSPGRITLWTGNIPANIIEKFIPATFFPVIVEVAPGTIRATNIPAFNADMTLTRTDLPECHDSCVCLIPSGVIPLPFAKSIHFRNNEEMLDFHSRKFDNIDFDALQCNVTPALFEGTPVDLDRLQELFAALDDPGTTSAASLYRRTDAFAGAIALMALTMPNLRKWPEVMKEMIDLKSPENVQANSDYGFWLSGLRNLLLSGEQFLCSGDFTADLFRVAASQLVEMNPKDGFEPSALLDRIVDRMKPCHDKDAGDEIGRFRERVLQILRNETDQISFNDDADPKKIVQRAITLFLMRREPERILNSVNTAATPGRIVLATAAVLAGIFSGYYRLSTNIKSKVGAEKNFLTMVAESCNRTGSADIVIPSWLLPEAVLQISKEDSFSQRISVKLGGEELTALNLHPCNSMMKVFHLAQEARVNLEYDFDNEFFLLRLEAREGCLQAIQIHEGKKIILQGTRKELGTIRFIADCPSSLNQNQVEAASFRLLALNMDTSLCRYALDLEKMTIRIISDQIVDTIDTEELLANINAVKLAYESAKSIFTELAPVINENVPEGNEHNFIRVSSLSSQIL